MGFAEPWNVGPGVDETSSAFILSVRTSGGIVKVSLFIELSVPKPWGDTTEADRINESLVTVEAADKAGFHAVWVTEHHFLEEYAHASAPEVVLAALARTTKNIRLGHGITQTIPLINHPARIAERVSTLDIVSGGRVEFGTGEGSSVAELDGFQVDPGKKRAMWLEGTKAAIRCMSETPFRGIQGEFVTMPPRNVVPKPVQKPHPPVWVACTQESTIDLAARSAIGALSFSLFGPESATDRVTKYYSALEEAIPFTNVINPNILFTGGHLVCAPTSEEALRRIGLNSGFFGFGAAHYYTGPTHRPGQEDLWQSYLEKTAGEGQLLAADGRPLSGDRAEWERLAKATSKSSLEDSPVGNVDQVRRWIERFEAAGADEVMFFLSAWNLEHDLETIELVGKHILPAVMERDAVHVAEKAKRLAPIIDKIEQRRVPDESPYPADYEFGGVPLSWADKAVHDEINAAMRDGAELQKRRLESQVESNTVR